jgi:flagellar biosynthetic protein FliR
MHALAAGIPDLVHWVGLVLWPFLRISALFTVAPLFGSQTIPVRIRVAVALVLAVCLAPSLPPSAAIDVLSASGVLAVAGELFIGLSMGFVLQLTFAGLHMAGELVATTMGLSMAQVTDPVNGAQVPVLGQLFFMVGMLLFLAMNGHLALLAMLVDSFRALPVGAAGLDGDALWAILIFAGSMFAAAVKVALPAVTALLGANIMLGVITRSAPQLNLFAFGLPITTALGLVLLLAALPGLAPAMAEALDAVLAQLAGIYLP